MFFLTISAIEIFGDSISVAQSKEWNILTSGRETIYRCTIVAVNDSLVEASHWNLPISIPVESVAVLTRDSRPSKFVAGAVAGVVVGGVVGGMVGRASYKKPTGEFAIDFGPGPAVVGGAIGAASGNEVHDLRERSHREKVEIIRALISKEKGEQ